jgi:hypothetical protein
MTRLGIGWDINGAWHLTTLTCRPQIPRSTLVGVRMTVEVKRLSTLEVNKN